MEKIKKALDQAREKRVNNMSISSNKQVNSDRHDLTHIDSNWSYTLHDTDDAFLENKRILNKFSKDEDVHPYKVLRTRLTQIMRENNWTSVAVVSSGQDDGKTTVGINLAISIAQGHQSASILLDLDLMSPTVHTIFDFTPEISLNDYFEGDVALNEILVTPGVEGFAFAPTSKPISRSSDYLSSTKGVKLISEVKKANQEAIIVIDVPPLLCSDDAIAFLPNVDCVVLVIREGKTRKEDIQRAMELLVDQNVAGVVLNDSVQSSEHVYYDYSTNK